MSDPAPTIAQRILGAQGPIARAMGQGYEPRPQQLEMAAAVAEALEHRSHLLVEAGTGVGKSFAYLVPAIHRALAHSETVVVATNTIALQEQILRHDIPALQATLHESIEGWSGNLRPVLVKGRGNYLSIRRLSLASERQNKILPDAAHRRTLHQIEDWAYRTEDGTLSTLPPLERAAVWDKVQSDSGNCMGRRCPTYEQCFYQSARREMESANLLVCNHALFFSDLNLRRQGFGFLPAYQHVILDEAHGVEDAAADHFGLSLSEGKVHHLLDTLWHARTRRGYLAQFSRLSDHATNADSEDPGDMLKKVERAVDQTRAADHAAREFFSGILTLINERLGPSGRIRQPGLVKNPLTEAMNVLLLRLKALRDALPEKGAEPDRFELAAYMQRAGAIADAAEALTQHSVSEDPDAYCYWAEAKGTSDNDPRRQSRRRSRPRITLACSPVEVGPVLKQHLFSAECSTILTSATLTTRAVTPDEPTERAETAFAHTLARLGAEGAKTLQLGSPFDYPKQVELFIEKSLPEPPKAGSRAEAAYTALVTGRVLDHVAATEGGAFVLFTSFGQLNRVADELEGPLAELGYPMLVHGRHGSRSEILEAFKHAHNAVLLGTASFWQGVDVKGNALRCVIIAKLPFDPPGRAIVEARTEHIEARGGNAFREDAIPRAIIRFKQGFGRLIRSQTDSGRVVILDPRTLTKPYGKLFLRALPKDLEPKILTD